MGYIQKTARDLIEGKLYWYQHTDDDEIKRVAFDDICFIFSEYLDVKLSDEHKHIIEFYVFDKVSFDEVVNRIKATLPKKGV